MTDKIDEVWMDLGAGEIFTAGEFVGADDDTEGLVKFIRAKAPADALTDREARDKQVRDEALREAAEAVKGARCNPWATNVILDLIEKGQDR